MLSPASATVPAAARATAPRVAVVGCGYWGRNLVRNFAELGALSAIVDPDRAAAEALAAAHSSRTMGLEDALATTALDALAIAAPAALHYKLAKAALEAGKHVFVEKPLALDPAEAEELCGLAAGLDRRLMVGHLLQYHPAFLKLKEVVAAGQLGKLQYVYSNRLNLGKIRREEDILWSFAPHDISMILALVGQEPDRVAAVGAYHLHQTIADVTTTHLHFPDDEVAHIFVSWLHPFKEQKLVAVGSDAMAVFDDGEPWARKLLVYPHRINWKDAVPVPSRAEAQPISLIQEEPLRLECQHFLDCVRDGSTPQTDGQEGLRVLRVLKRATDALRETMANNALTSSTAPSAKRFPGVTIHESAYVDELVEIGKGSTIWHFSHVLPDVRIGRNVSIGQNVVIGPRVTIGNEVKIQNNVSIYEGVTLEDGVFCGPSCVFTNVANPRAEISRKHEFRKTLVKRGASIGANATIVCGHTLGEYCFIGAGAVVTSDVPAHALMLGVPAKRAGWVSKAGVRLGADLVCSESGQRYREIGADAIEEIA